MVTLNTTTSIVDYLKSQNKPSDFTSRTSLYKNLGLDSRLGAYTGSFDQNTAFLKTLQTQSSPIIEQQRTPLVQAPPNATIEQPQTEYPATMTLDSLGIPKPPTTEDVTKQVMESPTFKL